MAKFCSNCGKKLEEGQVCDCKKEIVNNTSESLLNMFKGVFAKPMDTIKDGTKESNFSLALILVGILSIVTGLFAMAIAKSVPDLIMGTLYSKTGSLYGTSSLYGITNNYDLDIPYAEIFCTCIVMVFILSFIYAGILYFVNTVLFKGKANFKATFALYGTASIITSVCVLASAILAFVYFPLALLVLALGMILNLVYMITGLKYIGPKNENMYGYIYVVTMAIFYLVIFVIIKIFS